MPFAKNHFRFYDISGITFYYVISLQTWTVGVLVKTVLVMRLVPSASECLMLLAFFSFNLTEEQ